jgi:hypothetical protein
MAQQIDWFTSISQLIDILPQKTVQRGRAYFRDGRVLKLDCIKSETHYRAVVQGGEDYVVDLQFNESWEIYCTCPIGSDCKHGVAALLTLREQAARNRAVSPGAKEPFANRFAALKRSSPAATQPPESPLREKLMEALGGRKLSQAQSDFIRRLQTYYSRASGDGITESDMMTLARSGSVPVNYYSWQTVPLWAKRPQDDFYFWLHVAWELKRRSIPWPDFMEGITDLQLIEPVMRKWARDKEIEQWKKQFQALEVLVPQPSTGCLQLRLTILEEEARLQWRLDPTANFSDLKQAQAKTFATQFDKGTLSIAADSLPLWSSSYKPWSNENWWSFRYDNFTTLPSLGRMLRLPLALESIVLRDGQPLPRIDLPLRMDLNEPPAPGGDYRLVLSTVDNSPLPRILAVFNGRPALYLTTRGLFHGPYSPLLETDLQKDIPAEAVESAAGLRFLFSCGISLPTRLQHRILPVPVRVTITCSLRAVYQGSTAEDLVINVTAESPGMPPEGLTSAGWQAAAGSPSRSSKKSSKGDSITIPDRRIQSHFPTALEMIGAKWNHFSQKWTLRLNKKTPEIFVAWLKSLPPEMRVRLSKELATLRDEPISGSVAFDLDEAGIDWFDLRIKLEVSDTTLSPEELKLLLNARGGYVRLGKKGWRRLQYNLSPEENEQLARIGLHAGDFSSEPQRIHALQLADQAAKKFLGPERAEKIERRASELKTRVTPPLPGGIVATLRPYQTEGFHFLAYLTANRFGGVLADDMGLGKTLQTLAWLAFLREPAFGCPSPVLQPTLVLCPKSVMDNWRAEAERFYPGLRVRLWRGETAAELKAVRETTDLLVINYSQLRSLSPEITACPWLAVVLDEAQYIKNPDSQTAQVARALQSEHRLALTGTPIENRLLDLWSIFGFAMPGVLGNRAHFLRRFDAKDDPLARRRLAARVRPFLLRRTKAQVAKDLPDRIEEDLFCEMEAEQKTLYRAELKRARQIVLGLKTDKNLNEQRFNILTSLLRLRQICCHPALIDEKLRTAASAKVSALEDLLEPLMAEGHKVLVFSQFVTMLGFLRETVQQREWQHFYLAGDTENRGELVQQFQAANGGAVFLISLKAGGFGLNLTSASYVVLFDPWWNPAVENQAIDRTHRIGQTRKVMAYRLLMRDTIEQKIRLLQKQKGALADDVLGEERFAQSLTLNDLRFLFAE